MPKKTGKEIKAQAVALRELKPKVKKVHGLR